MSNLIRIPAPSLLGSTDNSAPTRSWLQHGYATIPTIATDKKRTSIYTSEEVPEYLAIRRAKGAGSIFRQLEDLAREKMPHRLTPEEIRLMEAQDIEGYRKHPLTGELDSWQSEQVWDDE